MLENSAVREAISERDQIQVAGITLDRESILKDFEVCCISREASLLARREVLTGKAKFGITGDGKEVPQVAMAKVFQKGDFRSGYYRDQTLILALGLGTVEDFFAQLYADAANDPFSGGRQMNSHFATPFIDEQGDWTAHRNAYNISSDVSSTGGQMARALGLAFASNKYRESKALADSTSFSDRGNEVCFCTIGDASTSEGVFWETVNAASVLQAPLHISVWDDGYGISVPIDFQTAKASISEALSGLQQSDGSKGLDIQRVKAWDYLGLIETYAKTVKQTREAHVPSLIHVQEVTQPQGHSTSGSHERYKSKERLQWENDNDCIARFESWIIENGLATGEETQNIRKEAKQHVKKSKDRAWKAFNAPTKERLQRLREIYAEMEEVEAVRQKHQELQQLMNPVIGEVMQNARRAYYAMVHQTHPAKSKLKAWIDEFADLAEQRYHTNLYSDSKYSALKVPVVAPEFSEGESEQKNGYEILNAFFDKVLERDERVFAFGEDVGQIGDVNQGFAGMQKKYGLERVFDTGIREWTIVGQAIGMAMRGLRPIAEIQYLDYLIFGLEPLTDDLATLRYRSNGQQAAPAIIRTRGHRLEGIWHAGSPLGMILNALRGVYVLVPRNMTQAAGFYNTMLQSDDPALIIECLNGYRLKEKLPANLGEYTVPLGVPEILREGSDLTIVTYGSCVRVAQAGAQLLAEQGIEVELIDPQSLLPFDLEHRIVESLKKTNRVLFMDEDVPGGATAFMMREVLEVQQGYRYLDSAPATLTAKAHRPPYGSDGDYFTKPNAENVFETAFRMIYEAQPYRFAEGI